MIPITIVILILSSSINAIKINNKENNEIKLGEVIIDENQASVTGEGISVYSTNVTITMPETIEIPGYGEFDLPEWLAGKKLDITDVTWREKIDKVNSSFDIFVNYQGAAPSYLITDLAMVMIYDLDLELTFEEILELINGNYSFLIDQLKNPTFSKVTFDEMDGQWRKFIDMENKRIFRDTYVIVGFYIDLVNQNIYRDAEMITFQTIKKKSYTDQKTIENENSFYNRIFEKLSPFYIRLFSSIISVVQRATFPDTLGHLST